MGLSIFWLLTQHLDELCFGFFWFILLQVEFGRCQRGTLAGKTYDTAKVADWSKAIADQIKGRIKEMGYDRYKVRFDCECLP